MRENQRILGERTLFEGPAFSVARRMVRLPDGRETPRDVVLRANAAAVVAVDDEGRVLMERQYRPSADAVTLEIPAGKMEAGETPAETARRELEEETGFTARDMRYLLGAWSSPGFCDEIIHIFLATGLSRGRANPDEGETIEVERVPLPDMAARVRDGEIGDMKTAAGILAAASILLASARE